MSANWEIREGDALERLREMPDASVQCCVTSPPYFGLRDYGIDGQIGLKTTTDEYIAKLVEVFGEVRRVLRDDGTLWLNIGSSYAGQDGYPITPTDAAWLAGLIDGEGCVQIHRQRKPASMNSVDSFQIDLSVGMLDREAVERAYAITGIGSCHQQNRGVWDWSVRGQQTATLLRALYPFLTVKKRRAAYAIMLAEDLASQKFGRGNPATDEAMAYRQAIKEAISALNQRQETTLLMREPKALPLGVKAKDDLMIPAQLALALRADGWYLRSDIIWAKPNPMPESVTDRPTSAHEHVFLLSKSKTYFYDADAIREADSGQDHARVVLDGQPSLEPSNGLAGAHGGIRTLDGRNGAGRNKRNVWEVATQPFAAAHFATFPCKLVEPCILAGSRPVGALIEPEYIDTPTGERAGDDPSMLTGRAGMNRPRGENEGSRRITVAEQRNYATQLRQSSHRSEMEAEAGSAFAHYLRTDASGARPISPALLEEWIHRGWLARVHPPQANAADASTAVVLDPFAGSGTTGLVALRHDRSFIGIELSPAYAEMARHRIRQDAPLLNTPAEAAA